MDRFKQRGQFIIPLLLHHKRAKEPIKAVMINISSKGLRAFSNDKRLLMMDEDLLNGREFELEFDFFDIPTQGLVAKVANITPGRNPDFEKQMGLEFVDIDSTLARRIDTFVQEHPGH